VVVEVFLAGCLQPSFLVGCIPIHPFVDPSAGSAGVRAVVLLDTEYSVATTSPRRAVSIKETLGL
jgi:hypothetical protein